MLAYNYLWTLYDLTWTPRDDIQLDFTLFSTNPTPPFVWGIIKKDEMAQLRRARWDLVRAALLLAGFVGVLIKHADVYKSWRLLGAACGRLRIL